MKSHNEIVNDEINSLKVRIFNIEQAITSLVNILEAYMACKKKPAKKKK
jgi:hypothetical protein